MPVFNGKCSPCTGKKLSCWYHVPAETEHFVRFVGDSLYSVLWVKKQVEVLAKQDHSADCVAPGWRPEW